jgi:hypothetical protein
MREANTGFKVSTTIELNLLVKFTNPANDELRTISSEIASSPNHDLHGKVPVPQYRSAVQIAESLLVKLNDVL